MLEDANFNNTTDSSLPQENTKTWGSSFTVDSTVYASSVFCQPLRNSDEPYTEIIESAENGSGPLQYF